MAELSPDDIRHTAAETPLVKSFRWSSEKNRLLATERGITFERIVVAIGAQGLLHVSEHLHTAQYPSQRIVVVACDGYAYLVP